MIKLSRIFFTIAAILTALLAGSCSNESQNNKNPTDTATDKASEDLALRRLTMPGTGVSLVPPDGTRLAPVGPYLMDPQGEIIVSVIVGQARKDRDNDLSGKLYPHFVRKIRVGHQTGELHKRTRKTDGGGYDAFWLGLYRGDLLLQVTAYYTGRTDSVFQSMASLFQTILWESDQQDRFLSFGYKITVEGLPEIPKGTGILSFGTPSDANPTASIEFSPLPIAADKIGDAMPFCKNFAARIFKGELRSGPLVIQGNNAELWEMTGLTKFNKSGTVDYVAILKTSEGGFIQATGNAPADTIQKWEKRFREALMNAENVR